MTKEDTSDKKEELVDQRGEISKKLAGEDFKIET